MGYNIIFYLMIALVALVDMGTDFYVPMLPEIADHFKVEESLTGATLSLNLVGLGLSGIFYGHISDCIGRRPVIIMGLSIFVAASFFCSISDNITQLLWARFLQGIGGGVAFSVGIAVVRDLYSGGASGAARFSQLQAIISISPCIGPILGGMVGCYYGWPFIFYILFICSWILLGLIIVFGKETLSFEKRLDVKSVLVPEYKSFLKNKLFLIYAGIQVAALFWLWAELSFTPVLLENRYNIPLYDVGFYMGASVLFYFAGTIVNQILLKRCSLEELIGVGIYLFVCGGLLLSVAEIFKLLSPWLVVLLKAPAIFGFALLFGNAGTLAIDQIQADRVGSASALIGAAELFAGAIGISIISLFEAKNIYPLSLMIIIASVIGEVLLRFGKCVTTCLVRD